MTRQDHLLTIAAEECMETAQRITKALRFGVDEVQPGQDMNNAKRIMQEFCDLVAMLRMVADHNETFSGEYTNVEQSDRWIEEKESKVERFLEYSAQQGRLEK